MLAPFIWEILFFRFFFFFPGSMGFYSSDCNIHSRIKDHQHKVACLNQREVSD